MAAPEVKQRIASINVEQVGYSIRSDFEVFMTEHLKEAVLFASAKTGCVGVNRVDIKYKRDTLAITG
jgi:hypothetical protein